MDHLEDRDRNGSDDLIARLGRRAEQQGDDAAFIFLADGKRETDRLTYGALERRARSVAGWIDRNGLAGERIVLLYRPGLDFVVGFLACLYAGAIAVPAYPPNPRHPDPRLQSILDDCAPAAAFCSEEDCDSLAQLLASRQLQVVATAAVQDLDASPRHRTIAHDAVAHLQYTSGSTGNPKGVMVTHGNLLHQCRYLTQVFGVGRQSVIVSWQPFFHDMGLVATLVGPVYWGARVVVMPPAVFLRSPITWLRAITEYRGTGAGAPNFAYELCVTRTTPAQREGLDLSSWECAVNGAEPIRADTLDRFCAAFEPYGFRRRTFLPSYGMAETTLCVTGSRVHLLPVVTSFRREGLEQGRAETCAAEAPQAARLVSSGVLGGALEVAIVDPDTLERQPEDVIGEIWVSGPAVAKGYWRRPEETQATFEARIRGEDVPYLRTGDLGFMREGELYVSGRLKDMVIIRGRNLYPQDIELAAQSSHPALELDCCVAFALEIDGREELGVAAELKRSARRAIDPVEVVEAVRAAIRAQFAVAVHWVGLVQPGGVPKTSSGKVMRSASRRLLHSGALPLLHEWRREQYRDPAEIAHAAADGSPSAPLPASSCASGRSPAAGAEPIAIVGLACRFPGAADAEAFWQLLEEGRDAIREVPPERWDADAYYDAAPGVPGKMNSRWGGFIDEMAGFDAAFFDISPREATSMDPQHRQLLEVSWLALEHAGIAPARLEGRAAGVFVGISTYDYKYILEERSAHGADAFMATGNAHSAAVGRLSFMLGLEGPCVAVDTACSSSLVAVHQAAQSLRLGECEVALAGGVNAVLRPEVNVAFAQAKLLSPKGRCRVFDAAADGYVRSEGCGMLVLKRLRDAERDGDRVLAVIRGSAVNQDGRSSGLTAPSGAAQSRVIATALRQADLDPAGVQYLECHGACTVLGDAIEVQAAGAIFARGRRSDDPLLLGSVKSNLGDLEAAAGIAGLIKVILALERGRIPRSLHFATPNPHVAWSAMPVKVAAQAVPWARSDARTRIAGVSSFGFAGTNAHMLIEEAPQQALDSDDPPGPQLLAISARNREALEQLAGRYAAWLRVHAGVPLAAVCRSANLGRNHLEHRAAVVCESRHDACTQLQALAQGKAGAAAAGAVPRTGHPRVAFLFSGQGLPSAAMALELYENVAAFRACIDRCAHAYAAHDDGAPPLQDMLFRAEHAGLMRQTRYVQPVLYSLQVALASLWQSWGCMPDAVLGHGAGEYAAACVAGVFGVEDGLGLVVERARLAQTLPASAMLSVSAPAPTVEAVVGSCNDVRICAYNGPTTEIGGPLQRLEALRQQFDAQELYCRMLPASNALHSAAVEPILERFGAHARRIEYAPPSVRLISSTTGKELARGETADAPYWTSHAREPVRFVQAVESLFEDGEYAVALELGPQDELVKLAQASVRPAHTVLWASSLAKGEGGMRHILVSAAQLHVSGVTLDFARMPGQGPRCSPALPSYPFQHRQYWPSEIRRPHVAVA